MVRSFDSATSAGLSACVILTGLFIAGMAGAGIVGVAAQAELVIHKEGTKQYHRPGCPVIRDAVGVLALTRGQAESRGYTAHPDCDPANQPPAETARGRARGRVPAPAPKITVYIDGPKYYHRKECSRLASTPPGPKAVPLETAAKSHWPCPACKAPILKKSTEPAIPGTNRRRGG